MNFWDRTLARRRKQFTAEALRLCGEDRIGTITGEGVEVGMEFLRQLQNYLHAQRRRKKAVGVRTSTLVRRKKSFVFQVTMASTL